MSITNPAEMSGPSDGERCTAPRQCCSAEQRFTSAYLAHSRETPALLDAWISGSPEAPRSLAVKAFMLVMLGRAEFQPQAVLAARNARMLATDADFRDRLFADAALAAAEGAWTSAVQQLETLMRLEPEDMLLLKLTHALRFMLGDKAGLLFSAESALERLSPTHPQRGFALGMQAFALEEVGRYSEAERIGRIATALNETDVWGLHAVSHAQEMTGQVEAGIAFIEGREEALRRANNFGGHLFWHLALFRLEKRDFDAVLDLYDREVRREKTDDFRDLANAASLLSRLERAGQAVGNRWEELADKAEARIHNRAYVFADLHAMLALLGAGRDASATRLALAMRNEKSAYAAQDDVARDVGALFADGMAHIASEPKAALRKMLAARSRLAAIGGSDAQRDVFEQVMVDAALRAGDTGLAEDILKKRLAARGGRNSFAETRLCRIKPVQGRSQGMGAGAMALLANLGLMQAPEAGHRHG